MTGWEAPVRTQMEGVHVRGGHVGGHRAELCGAHVSGGEEPGAGLKLAAVRVGCNLSRDQTFQP